MSIKRTEKASRVFKSNIAKLRHEFGYSLAQVGEAVGMGKSAIWKLENGDTWPKPEVLDRLADLYQISIADLFQPDGAAKKAVELNTTRENVLELFKKMLLDGRVPNDFWQSLKKEAG